MKKARILPSHVLSSKGKNWDDQELNETNLFSNTLVKYRNKLYMTGNRRNNHVELFLDHKFIRVVSTHSIYLVKINLCKSV